jgi:hypothetical protein
LKVFNKASRNVLHDQDRALWLEDCMRMVKSLLIHFNCIFLKCYTLGFCAKESGFMRNCYVVERRRARRFIYASKRTILTA